ETGARNCSCPGFSDSLLTATIVAAESSTTRSSDMRPRLSPRGASVAESMSCRASSFGNPRGVQESRLGYLGIEIKSALANGDPVTDDAIIYTYTDEAPALA